MRITFFNHTTEVVEICTAYWEVNSEGEFSFSTTAIGKRYGLTANKITQIAKEYSCAYSDSLKCCSCSVSYQYENRTDYYSAIKITTWTCKNCLANEKIILDEKKKIVLSHEFISQRKNCPLSIERLDVRSAILLLSLIRYAANEDLTFINEYFTNKTERFSPDTDDRINRVRA